MNFYEVVIIFNHSLTEEDVNSSINKVSEIIANTEGEILKTDNWGKKKLAYKLNKQTIGLYVLFLFKSTPVTIKKLTDYFKTSDFIIKFMFVKLNKKQIESLPKEILGVPVTREDVPISMPVIGD